MANEDEQDAKRGELPGSKVKGRVIKSKKGLCHGKSRWDEKSDREGKKMQRKSRWERIDRIKKCAVERGLKIRELF